MPIPSLLSIANKFKINFLTLYSAITFYTNTLTFINCQSLQNQFSHLIQCHHILRQYIDVYQLPISSKSIFSPYTMPLDLMPTPSHLSSANQFKINFLPLYNAIRSYTNTLTFIKYQSVQNQFLPLYNAIGSYANTFTFIKCQSLQNQFSPLIQCHRVLCQYLHVYQVPITSKSILSHYTMPSGLTPIPSCLSSANQFKINFLPLYNAIGSYTNTFTFIKCQSLQNQFSLIIQCHWVLCQYLHIYQVPINSKSIFSFYTPYTAPLHLMPICQDI